jgi:hypothetical protein
MIQGNFKPEKALNGYSMAIQNALSNLHSGMSSAFAGDSSYGS